jgi:hypothetical protein
MPFTLVGWSKQCAAGATLDLLNALDDPHIRYEGTRIIVPSLNKLISLLAVGANITDARITSPSLRKVAEIELAPLNRDAEPLSPPAILDLADNPLELVTGEHLEAKASNDASAAVQQTVLAWLGDGPVKPVAAKYISVKATASATLEAYKWKNAQITLTQTLPYGRYQIIGMRAQSAGLIAARLVIPGYPWRPGVPGTDVISDIDAARFRYGRCGVFGEFMSDQPPSVDFLSSSADTSEVVWLDIVPVA